MAAVANLVAETASCSLADHESLASLAHNQQWDALAEKLGAASKGLNINAAISGDGDTLLHALLKVQDAPARLVALAAQCSADVTAKNGAGQTPLDLVPSASPQQAVALIRSMDAKHINCKLSSGKTLLEAATAAKLSPVMAAAIVKGADVSCCGTKLAKQAIADNDDVLLGALVLKVKASVLDTLDLDYKRLCAAQFPHAAAQFLVRTVPELGKMADAEGNTPLHTCATDGGPGLLATELLHAAGNTALHAAARAGNLAVAKALCECGANVMARNKNNRTPKMQPKVDAEMKAFLYDMEELHKEGKLQQRAQLWDGKMMETQTESAFGIRAL